MLQKRNTKIMKEMQEGRKERKKSTRNEEKKNKESG